jgi:hypothetical protein
MVYEPAAFVHHRHRRGYGELLSQLEGYGLGYTAMLTSLVLSDPGHLLSLSSQLPSALGRKITQGIERIRGKRSGEASNQAATSPTLRPWSNPNHRLSPQSLGLSEGLSRSKGREP